MSTPAVVVVPRCTDVVTRGSTTGCAPRCADVVTRGSTTGCAPRCADVVTRGSTTGCAPRCADVVTRGSTTGCAPRFDNGCSIRIPPVVEPRATKHAGFTLVEVMAALAIFAMAALAGVAAATNHLNDLAYMEERTMARYAAANALARITLSENPRELKQGTETVASKQWHWRATFTETVTADVSYVEVTVRPSQDSTEKSYILGRYLRAPQ
ncbi:type II secretion system minor pseudopilin GspI [Pseudidiomarina homiensis]|uniref:Type II secretion system protein I n=1 Tax=Pseudidiomarina homiensis TaxID=364198 RepID=A0A432Y5P3_9GAMM|nr:type II secretion system minor pseudopilin GspI [Pseudidiomarina homiensis]RUO56284.1 type II secretion system protein GspI [Pseudidiomarina homiensis]